MNRYLTHGEVRYAVASRIYQEETAELGLGMDLENLSEITLNQQIGMPIEQMRDYISY